MADTKTKKNKNQYGSLYYVREGLDKLGILSRVIGCDVSDCSKMLTLRYKNHLGKKTIIHVDRTSKRSFYVCIAGNRRSFEKANHVVEYLKDFFAELFLRQEYHDKMSDTTFLYYNTLSPEKRKRHYEHWRAERLAEIETSYK